MSRGGPDGGRGGAGGSVVVRASRHYRTLQHLKGKQVIRAVLGEHGQGKKKQGKGGRDVVIEVPVGTTVWRVGSQGEKVLLLDLVEDGQELVCARGGSGGKGNADFVTPTNREPLLAQAGEPGEIADIVLELKLLADVGIVGQPSAGKSTFLSIVSRAKPEIALYPFTTVEPVLGVVETTGEPFVMVEIPGLVEGAHEGRGLGLEFLRHAERTRVLLHLVDGAAEDPLTLYTQLNRELAFYSKDLASKPQVVALSKVDLPSVRERVQEVQKTFLALGVDLHPVSAVTGEGVKVVLGRLLEALARSPASYPGSTPPSKVASPVLKVPRIPQVWREGEVIVVSFLPAERLVALADLRRWEVRVQLHREMERMGVVRALRQVGVKKGDTVRIGSVEMEWV